MYVNKDFVYYYGEMDKKYGKEGHLRWPTFKSALTLMSSIGIVDPVIVETGCTRQPNDWGGGMSTILLGEYCSRYGGRLHTVDIDSNNMSVCKTLTSEYSNSISYHVDDSVNYLKSFDGIIDLLYLDSFDYPYGDLLDLYGGKVDIEYAKKELAKLSEQEIVDKYYSIIRASQEHCLREIEAALPHLSWNAPVLIDDNDLPGGGKSRLAKECLQLNGYRPVLDMYQSLWTHT